MTGKLPDRDGPVFCARCGKGAIETFDGECRDCFVDSFEEPDDDDYLHEPYDNCHLMPDGQCLLAGTEECDWECGRLR